MPFNYTLSNGSLADATEVMSDLNQLPIKADSNTITGAWIHQQPTVQGLSTASTLVINGTAGDYDAVLSMQLEGIERYKIQVDDSANDNLLLYDVKASTAVLTHDSDSASLTIGQTAKYKDESSTIRTMDTLYKMRDTVLARNTSTTTVATAASVVASCTASASSYVNGDLLIAEFSGYSTVAASYIFYLSDGTNTITETLASSQAYNYKIEGTFINTPSGNNFYYILYRSSVNGTAPVNISGSAVLTKTSAIGLTLTAAKVGATNGNGYGTVSLYRKGNI